jgi:integrase
MSSNSPASRKANWPPNLALRGGRFYVAVRVPESLRGIVTTGRQTHIRRSLHTSNEAEAIRRHRIAVAEIKALIESARREPDGSRKGKDPAAPDVAADAAWWREHLKAEGIAPARAFDDVAFAETIDKIAGEPLRIEIGEDGRERAVFDPQRERQAMELADLVTGRRVPVATELERFLEDKRGRAGGPLSSRYVSRIRRAVRGLGAWLAARSGGDNVASVTRYEAGLYAEHLGRTCNTAQTASSLITALSSYWRWMVKRGAAAENPWKDQTPETRTSPQDADKRPYTDDEIKRLLSGDTYSTLHDMMRIAALSGLRINEIGRLTVADCEGGVFNIREAKTAAGVRRVPIHPTLDPIIARRREGKRADAFLIEELSARKDHTTDRAAKASERFTTYRRELGIDERKDGQRQSNIDFHSFRRWFVTKAEEAGQPPHIISAVVGHAEGRQGMTLGLYSGGPSEAQMRAVVESVQLPEGAPADKIDGSRMGDGRWPQRGRTSGPKARKD